MTSSSSCLAAGFLELGVEVDLGLDFSFGFAVHKNKSEKYEISYCKISIKDTSYAWGPKMTPLLCFISYLC